MKAMRRQVDRLVEACLALLMVALVAVVCWQVASRFLLRAPSSYTEEAARFLLIWVGLLGAAYALGRRMHLSIDLLARWRPRWMGALERSASASTIAFAALVMGLGGGRLMWIVLDLEQTSAALGWKLGWVYTALPLSGALLCFYALAELTGAGREE